MNARSVQSVILNDNLVNELGSVKGSDFEVLRMDGLVTP